MSTVLDWFKYSRLEIRPLAFPCVPKGPNFANARNVKCLVAGNQLTIKLPRHSPDLSITPQFSPKRDSALDFPFHDANADVMGDDSWRFSSVLFREWRFNGPWFSGVAGSLSIGIQVIKPRNPSVNATFFHPKALEQVIASYLTSRRAHEKTLGVANWQAPLNWQRTTSMPVPAGRFDVLPVNHGNGSPEHIFFFPVGDHFLLEVTFRFSQNCTGMRKEKDQKISREPMWELVNNILDSMTLTLSSENQAKVDKIKAECPDYALSETFPPLQWSGSSKTGEDNPSPALKLASY